jgi:MOSC domain-containing protein YiiM
LKLLAICIGQPKTIVWRNQEVLTSIFKTPVEGSVLVKRENIVGDRQSDLSVHGGFDKAIYAYSHDTYSWWEEKLASASLPYGSFGENLTFDHLDETQIFVGDVFEIGSCLLEAVQPRVPCFKLGIKFDDQKVIQYFNEYHRSGVYFRVKREGSIKRGDSLKLLSSETIQASISELFQFVKDKGIISKERASELAKLKSLNDKWRNKFIQISQGLDKE